MAVTEVMAFEVLAIKQGKTNKDGDQTEAPSVLFGPKVVLAADGQQAQMLAGREIPEEELSQLGRITLAVRPF